MTIGVLSGRFVSDARMRSGGADCLPAGKSRKRKGRRLLLVLWGLPLISLAYKAEARSGTYNIFV